MWLCGKPPTPWKPVNINVAREGFRRCSNENRAPFSIRILLNFLRLECLVSLLKKEHGTPGRRLQRMKTGTVTHSRGHYR